MNKKSFVGASRYIISVLIATQGLLILLLAVNALNNAYMHQWEQYGNQSGALNIYFNENFTNSKDIEEYLYKEAIDNNLFIIRKDLYFSNGNPSGFKFGIYGNADNNNVSYSFYGKEILSKEMLNELQMSNNESATIGVDSGSVHSLYDIPAFRFGGNVVIKKLSTLIKESGTLQGKYIILGADNNLKNDILTNLSALTNSPEDRLTTASQGEHFDNSFINNILTILLIVLILLNTVFFLMIVIRNINKWGKLALMGWSRTAYCYEVFGRFIWTAIALLLPLSIIGVIASGWNESYFRMLFGQFFLYSVFNLIITSFEIGVASLVVFSISPINAIKDRFPKHILYAFGIIGYIAMSTAIIFCSSYIDEPIGNIKDNIRISKSWNKVSEYQIFKEVSIGNDESSFVVKSNALDQKIFDWYNEIHNNSDVLLITTQFYDRNLLDLWRSNGVYSNIPSEPFWYFVASKSYLDTINIKLSDEIYQQAEEGVRTYLIPSNMDDNCKKNIEKYFEESSVKGIKGSNIQTTFNKNKEFKFVEYNADSPFFTWTTDPKEELYTNNPVIYLCTPQNMMFVESKSLKASGFNGYIKFRNSEAAKKYLSTEIMSKYNLVDNNLVFSDVNDYIDGLQKELITGIFWLGMSAIILSIILIGILISIATVFRISNQNRLNVEKFMGFSFIKMYQKPLALLVSAIIIESIVMIAVKSKFGLLINSALSVVQLIIFFAYMSRNEIKNILKNFKGW